jgi:hypothetical protein
MLVVNPVLVETISPNEGTKPDFRVLTGELSFDLEEVPEESVAWTLNVYEVSGLRPEIVITPRPPSPNEVVDAVLLSGVEVAV